MALALLIALPMFAAPSVATAAEVAAALSEPLIYCVGSGRLQM